MIRKLNLKIIETAAEVLKLQQDSYRVEAELIGFDNIPPLHDSIDSLMKCDEEFYGYFAEDILAGIISYKISEDTLDIHRVAVQPQFFRMGIANKLLSFIEKHESSIKKLMVCTGKENLPAVNLYLKNGYRKVKDIEIGKGIYITEFEKIR